MPELPDVTVYIEALSQRIVGQPCIAYAILNPFVLRTVEPSLNDIVGRSVNTIERLGKRIVMEFDNDVFIVIHLMIAGRFRWHDAGPRKKVAAKISLAELEFPTGTLTLTEAGSKRRASLHVVHNPGALETTPRRNNWAPDH